MFKLCRAVVGGLNSTLEQSQESGRSKFPEMNVGEARNDSDHEGIRCSCFLRTVLVST
jgi:hypothetical protein